MDNANRQLKLNGKIIYSLDELKENFNAEELVTAYKDGSLIRWLEFFFYGKIADKVKAVNPDENLIEQLTHIFMNSDEYKNIFGNTETLMKEAADYCAKKNYREAVKKYMDAYYLGNDEAGDKLRESLGALLKSQKQSDATEIVALKKRIEYLEHQLALKSKQTVDKSESQKQSDATEIATLKKSRKFISIIAAILAVTTIIFSAGYFKSVDEFENERAKYLDEITKLRNDCAKYKNDISVLKQELDGLKKIANSPGGTVNGSNIHANNSNIRGDRNVIDGNNNEIYGDDNKIYGNNNRVYGNRNEVIQGKNNIAIRGDGNRGFSN